MPPTTFQDRMRAAAQLTRAGDLHGATALIQRALADRTPVHESRPTPTPTPASAWRLPGPRPAGQVLRGRHTAAGLTREYRLFVPAPRTDRAPGLVVMLHGCTQDADDFAAGTGMDALAAEHGLCVLYPSQSTKANPNGCWNWFKHGHQGRGRGEPALLASLTSEISGQHAVDSGRVYVAGLSAGGAMALVLGESYPETFAAIGVHSGLPRGSANDVPSALRAMNQGPGPGVQEGVLPTIVFHGDADTTVHPRNGLAVASRRGATQSGRQAVPSEAGGRRCMLTVYQDPQGRVVAEHWLVHGAGHAWSGGHPGGSHVDTRGPDASREMVRFFLAHARPDRGS